MRTENQTQHHFLESENDTSKPHLVFVLENLLISELPYNKQMLYLHWAACQKVSLCPTDFPHKRTRTSHAQKPQKRKLCVFTRHLLAPTRYRGRVVAVSGAAGERILAQIAVRAKRVELNKGKGPLSN